MANDILDSTELPVLQPDTHCVLVARDPNCLYAYWDFKNEDVDQARRQAGSRGKNAQLVLRMYDVTMRDFNGHNANHAWDVEVSASNRDGFINVWQDNAVYCAELGLRPSAHHFIPVTRSNIVHAPRKTMSDRYDLIWQDIEGNKMSQPYVREAARAMRKHGSGSVQDKVLKPRKHRNYHLTAEDIRAYYKKLFATFSRLGKKKKRKALKLLSLAERLERRYGLRAWQLSRPLIGQQEYLSKFRRMHLAGSQGGELLGGASEQNFSLGSHSLFEGASKPWQNREFFFEIWTELLVYGRTHPDAAVRLNEKSVKLNPDGTFSLRYALPDGEIPLKFAARSADQVEERHIHTGVERETTVHFPKILKEFHGQNA